MKSIRALKINAETGIVSEVIIKDWKEISQQIGCDLFTCVNLGNGETLYVDDEGLINGTRVGFTVNMPGMPVLMGSGLIMGTDDNGDSIDTKLAPADLAKFGITHAFNLETRERIALTSAATLN